MSNPIVFISFNRVKEGMFDDFKKHYLDNIQRTQADKPGTLVQLAYTNDDETELAIIRVFPDAQAMDWQLQGADERSKKTYQFIEPTRIEIYGTPNDNTMEVIKKVAGAGIEVRINPKYSGGFIRLTSR